MTQDERKGLILCLKIEFSDGLGGGGRRLWECGKPNGFSIISMAGARGERGR